MSGLGLYARVGKRLLDLAVGVPALVVAAPVIAASIAVVRASGV